MADHSAMEMTIGIGAYLPQRWKTRAFEGCERLIDRVDECELMYYLPREGCEP
jgi:hypothetical protein